MKQQLFQTVARYVCGFLNSQVEGKLILGVTDKCKSYWCIMRNIAFFICANKGTDLLYDNPAADNCL